MNTSKLPTPTLDARIRLLNRCQNASHEELVKIEAIVDAFVFHELDGIETMLADQDTSDEERVILLSIVEKVKAELVTARFQPLFTRRQVEDIEANQQKARDMRRRISLSVLSMTEKRLQHTAMHQLEGFAALFEEASIFVDDSKAQLEMAEAARNRLMLIGLDHVGVEA